jgi:hypothetical protein
MLFIKPSLHGKPGTLHSRSTACCYCAMSCCRYTVQVASQLSQLVILSPCCVTVYLFISAPFVQGQRGQNTITYVSVSCVQPQRFNRGSTWLPYGVRHVFSGLISTFVFDILHIASGRTCTSWLCSPRAITAKSRRFHLPRDDSLLTRRGWLFAVCVQPAIAVNTWQCMPMY